MRSTVEAPSVATRDTNVYPIFDSSKDFDSKKIEIETESESEPEFDSDY